MMGLLIGSFLSGYLSDIYGRKYGLLGCILVSSTGSLVGAFMPDYWSYLALRIVTAIGAVGLFLSTFTMTIELMGSKEVRAQFQKYNVSKTILFPGCHPTFAPGHMLLTKRPLTSWKILFHTRICDWLGSQIDISSCK